MRFILISVISLLFCSTAWANDLLIFHSNNESSHYSNLKSHYEGLGFTVTGSTSGTVSSSLLSGKEMVIDITGNSNCGSTCRTNYDSFVSGGGILIIAAENGATNRIGNIESLIENKMQVGSYTATVNANDLYQSIRYGDYASGTSSENYLVGVDGYMYSITGGEIVATNTANNTSLSMWHKWDYGSNGGAVYVTFGYGQFLGTLGGSTANNNMDALLTSIAEEEGLYSSTPQAAITTSQQTTVNTARNKTQTGNKIYMTQSGSGIDLDIMQDGDDNLIIGTDLTSAANITGDSISLSITQKNTDNVLGIDINGNSNDVDIWQDTSQRAIVDITGASNTVALMQLHLSGSGAHHSSINVAGNSNSVTIDQKETGDKILFLDIDSSNTVDIDQLGTGDHFLDVTLTDNHTVTVVQDGSGTHNGYLDLSGNPTTMNLTQDSSTDQNYYLQQSCATNTCSVSVTQN